MSFIRVKLSNPKLKVEITLELTFLGAKKIAELDDNLNPIYKETILPLNGNQFTSVTIRSVLEKSTLPTSISIRNDNQGRPTIQAPDGTKRVRILVLYATNERYEGVVGKVKTVKFKDGNQQVYINKDSIVKKPV